LIARGLLKKDAKIFLMDNHPFFNNEEDFKNVQFKIEKKK
jgi:hypothetical protein